MVTYTDRETVGNYLKLNAGTDDEELDKVVGAVNSLINRWKDSADKPEYRFAATMLAARVYRRRNSPAGVEALGEAGPVYVSRYDPDLSMMLGINSWGLPKVG